MKIGIIGSGNMGRTLGLTWAEKGHDVFFGSRNDRDLRFIREVAGGPIRYGSIKEAILYGDVLLYSLRDTLPSSILDPFGWAGKIIIDCNNGEIPSDFNYPPVMESYTEKYQRDLPGSKIVKAFNTMAQELYSHDTSVIMASNAICFLAGDDEGARRVIAGLIRETGLRPVDAGLSYNARLLESFADLVRLLMIRNNEGPFLTFTTNTLPPADTHRLGQRQATNYQ